jgi:hypothetical protein
MYFHVPGLGQAGSFARMLSVFTFAAAMAAAWGLEGICRRLREREDACRLEGRCPWNLTASTGICAVLLVVLAWELLPWAHEFLPRTRREHLYPVTPAIERLMAAEGRVLEVTPREEWGMARAPHAVLPPNAATVYGYDSIGGYDSLMVTDYRAYLSRAEGDELAPAVNGNMLLSEQATGSGQMLAGVGTVLAHRRPPIRSADQTVTLRSSHGRVAVYEVAPVLPRAFTVDTIDPVALQAEGEVALLETGPARWERTGNGVMRVHIPAAAAQGTLCITETFYPGWNAYVDSERREVMQVFGAFCGVSTRGGETEVRLVFEPATVRAGCFFALTSLGLLAAVIAAAALPAGRRTRRDN